MGLVEARGKDNGKTNYFNKMAIAGMANISIFLDYLCASVSYLFF